MLSDEQLERVAKITKEGIAKNVDWGFILLQIRVVNGKYADLLFDLISKQIEVKHE